jgi:hypothetical protein
MLKQTSPHTLDKLRQADNCRKLIEILVGQIARGEPESNLDQYIQPCKTQYCLLGEYLNESYKGYWQFHDFCVDFDTEHEFGFGSYDFRGDRCEEWNEAFGTSAYGTRQQRITRLQSHIERLEKEAISCE